MKNIPSEVFTHYYAIFVPDNSASVYKNYIEENKLIDKGINILQQIEQPEVCAIVIPHSKEYKSIEKGLFDIQDGKGGFWGQYGLGYKGKTWKVFP